MTTSVDFAAIADGIAARAREVIAERGIDDLVSVLDHPYRSAFSEASRFDQKAMDREMFRALRPLAEEFEFTDIHVGTAGGVACYLREKILEISR